MSSANGTDHGRSGERSAALPAPPEFTVVIEIPRGGFVKRGLGEAADFVSPLPCPFNYGAIHELIGGDDDLLDAVVLGPRLARGTRVRVRAFGAVGLSDRGLYDDKLVCSLEPPSALVRRAVVAFFHLYALAKRGLNLWRGRRGRTACEGWGEAGAALARARPRGSDWHGPSVPF